MPTDRKFKLLPGVVDDIGSNLEGIDMRYVTMGHVAQYVRRRVELGEFSSESAEVARWALRSFVHHVREVEIGLLDEVVVESWLRARRREPATIKSMLGKLRPFVRWLAATRVITRDFTIGIRAPKVPDALPRCLDPWATSAVLRACPDQRARTVVLLMLHCGLRVGEVARLRLEDIDFERRATVVRGKGGRGRPTRSVPIPGEAFEYVRRLAAGRRKGPLICSYQPPFGHLLAHSLSALVREWMTAAGIKSGAWDGVSAHACRHTTAQDLVDQGVDLRKIQRLLGHRSIRTTEDYTRRDPKGLAQALEGRKYA